MNLHLRSYNNTDNPNLLSLLDANTPQFFAASERDDYVFYLEHEIEYYIVVEYQGQIIGGGGYNVKDETTIHLSWGLVHPSYQGQGVGRLLVQDRLASIQRVYPTHQVVVRTSQLVYKFYARLGFVLKHVEKDYWAKGFDLYYMVYTRPI